MAIYSIDPTYPFADSLAAGVLARATDDPMVLAGMTILLPTRRAQRTMHDAFLRCSAGVPLLLPRLVALGDLDDEDVWFAGLRGADTEIVDIPPALPPLRRRLMLSRMVLAKGDETGRVFTPDQAARLADALARLLDQVHTEGCDLAALAVEERDRFAQHWQIIAEFLSIVTEAWPRVLAAEGCLDAADRRNRLLRAQARMWQHTPPQRPVIAAGITGSIPAAADLLAVIARLPCGDVVLPGLDRLLDEDAWESVDESHPQFALKRLLTIMGCRRQEVAEWAVRDDALVAAGQPRQRLVCEVMRPAVTTHTWQALKQTEQITDTAVDGISLLECPTHREEALAIALIMRGELEHPQRTVALVTPDRDLARRVVADLGRWHIRVDDSAGRPLAVTPPGAFLRLTAAMVAERFAPIPLLAALKHPLAGAGMDLAVFRDGVRRLDVHVLRGVRPAPGVEGLRAALAAADVAATDRAVVEGVLDALEACCRPLTALIGGADDPPCAFDVLLDGHLRMAEALAAVADMPGPLRLWAGDAGEAAAEWARELTEAASILGPIASKRYTPLVDVLMTGREVRRDVGNHPRLAILGPMEARLRHADVVIVGGMNEDVWPPRTAVDPWMSRPMRTSCGLPHPEQRIGHAAHDLSMVLCAPQVFLTRARKVNGTPTVPSRWLLRLKTVLQAGGVAPLACTTPWDVWAADLDRPGRVCPVARPAPCPPVSARPRALAVTRVETWMRDPYAIYAQYILGLRALDTLDAEPGPGDYGTLVHRAFERFLQRPAAADPLATLLDCGREAFADHIARPAVWAFWWPRFERLATWAVAQEEKRRDRICKTHVEITGSLELGDFTLRATADRIDLMHDGSLAIIDYKTGTPPKSKEVRAGFSPQLPLEAFMAKQGAFDPALAGRPISELVFWHLKGDSGGGTVKSAVGKDTSMETLMEEAVKGLRGLIEAFAKPDTPYLARPHVTGPRYSDYDHLARVREWSVEEGDDE